MNSIFTIERVLLHAISVILTSMILLYAQNSKKTLTQQYYSSPYYSVGDILDSKEPTLTIKSITSEEIYNRTTGRMEDKPVLWFKGGGKGFVLSKDHCEQLEQLFGLDPRSYKGKRVQLKLQHVRGMSTISIHDLGGP